MATAALLTWLAGLAACQSEPSDTGPSPERPNVVFVLLDDVRYARP